MPKFNRKEPGKGTYINPKDMKKGEFIEGIFMGSEEKTFRDGNTGLNHSIFTTDNELIGLNGRGQLDYLMATQCIPGDYIRITYDGKAQIDGKFGPTQAHQFLLDVADEDDVTAKLRAKSGFGRRPVAAGSTKTKANNEDDDSI